MDLRDLVRHINRHHQTSFALTGRLSGGTHGTYGLLLHADGTRAVLKPAPQSQRDEQLARTVRVVDALRSAGYPAPEYLHVGRAPDGTAYYVQQFLEGEPVADVTAGLLDQILALNALQANRDARRIAADQDWSRHVHCVVFEDESRWAPAMRAHSADTAALLEAIQALTRSLAGVTLPSDDIVHSDFGPGNVLAHAGRVTGVIDLEAAGCGSRAIDLAVLLRWAGRAPHRRSAPGWPSASRPSPAHRAQLSASPTR